jgi:hypothetical protein
LKIFEMLRWAARIASSGLISSLATRANISGITHFENTSSIAAFE